MSYNQGTSNGRYRHGKYLSPEYKVWGNMRSRCLNPNHPRYKDWGGRGITVVDKWLTFDGFYDDMGERPSPKHTIERRDNTLGYSKENCYWATTKEQSANRRSNKYLSFQGLTLCHRDWAEKLGISKTTIYRRIRYGWPIEQILKEYNNG